MLSGHQHSLLFLGIRLLWREESRLASLYLLQESQTFKEPGHREAKSKMKPAYKHTTVILWRVPHTQIVNVINVNSLLSPEELLLEICLHHNCLLTSISVHQWILAGGVLGGGGQGLCRIPRD